MRRVARVVSTVKTDMISIYLYQTVTRIRKLNPNVNTFCTRSV